MLINFAILQANYRWLCFQTDSLKLVILAVFTFVVSLLNNKGQWHRVLLHLCGIALFNVSNGDDLDSRSSYVEGEWQGNAMIGHGVVKIR